MLFLAHLRVRCPTPLLPTHAAPRRHALRPASRPSPSHRAPFLRRCRRRGGGGGDPAPAAAAGLRRCPAPLPGASPNVPLPPPRARCQGGPCKIQSRVFFNDGAGIMGSGGRRGAVLGCPVCGGSSEGWCGGAKRARMRACAGREAGRGGGSRRARPGAGPDGSLRSRIAFHSPYAPGTGLCCDPWRAARSNPPAQARPPEPEGAPPRERGCRRDSIQPRRRAAARGSAPPERRSAALRGALPPPQRPPALHLAGPLPRPQRTAR
jgi:hypothetical protein